MAWQKCRASSTEYGSIIRYANRHYIFIDMQTLIGLDTYFDYEVRSTELLDDNPEIEVWFWDEPVKRENGSTINSSFLYLAQKLLDIDP